MALGIEGDSGGEGFGASRQDLRPPFPEVRMEIFAKPFLLRSRELYGEDGWDLRQKLSPELSWREALALCMPKTSALFLPHWLILCSWLLVWTALLLWRERRRRRGNVLAGTA